MEMKKVKCINAEGTTNLKVGENYYAFTEGDNPGSAYISRFPREGSHMGGYQLDRFEATIEDVVFGSGSIHRNEPATVVFDVIEVTEELEPVERVVNLESDNGGVAISGDGLLLFRAKYKTINSKKYENPYLYVVALDEKSTFGTVYDDLELSFFLGTSKLEVFDLELIESGLHESLLVKGMPLALNFEFFLGRKCTDANQQGSVQGVDINVEVASDDINELSGINELNEVKLIRMKENTFFSNSIIEAKEPTEPTIDTEKVATDLDTPLEVGELENEESEQLTLF